MNIKILNTITGETRGDERAYYNLTNTAVKNCIIDGEEDGESAFKESRDLSVDACVFKLRYPFWHGKNISISSCDFSEGARAPFWYMKNVEMTGCKVNSVKGMRESDGVKISSSEINSEDFGWNCRNISFDSCKVTSECFLFGAENVKLKNVTMDGKYSFQYVKNMTLSKCVLNTKDAFWHSKNVTVKNCTLNGEYLGWYSKNLKLVNCVIKGMQPLCYCKGLKLVNCTMIDCNLAFEYSDVKADINGTVLSVKNPMSGRIIADGYGEVIRGNSVYKLNCKIETREAGKKQPEPVPSDGAKSQ